MVIRIFLHGLESSNQGTKSVFFREKFPDMIIPNFSGDLQERMARLKDVLSGRAEIIMVGSSFGGLMASLFALEHEERIKRLILLAPALHWIARNMDPLPRISVPTLIYHGKNDEVIPLTAVEATSKAIFKDLSFTILEDDHFLHRFFTRIDWNDHLYLKGE